MAQNLPRQMLAIETSGPGGPKVLRIATRPVPQPNAGEVLIRVVAAGVNGPDMMQRKGLYPPPAGATDLLGLEVSGEVVAAGADAKRWKIGDQVAALTNGGGYAAYGAGGAPHWPPPPAGVLAHRPRGPARNQIYRLG